jgi:hypothetical protein
MIWTWKKFIIFFLIIYSMIGGRGCMEGVVWKWQKFLGLQNGSLKNTQICQMNLAILWPHNSSLKVLIKNISSDKLSPLKRTFPNTYCTIQLEMF